MQNKQNKQNKQNIISVGLSSGNRMAMYHSVVIIIFLVTYITTVTLLTLVGFGLTQLLVMQPSLVAPQ
jgi:hypothetical protein